MATRLPADWMEAVDDRIREWLNDENVASQSRFVEENPYEYHRNTVGRRLRLLSKANLVEKVGPGVYGTTQSGREYLSGDADLREEPKPEVNMVDKGWLHSPFIRATRWLLLGASAALFFAVASEGFSLVRLGLAVVLLLMAAGVVYGLRLDLKKGE